MQVPEANSAAERRILSINHIKLKEGCSFHFPVALLSFIGIPKLRCFCQILDKDLKEDEHKDRKERQINNKEKWKQPVTLKLEDTNYQS